MNKLLIQGSSLRACSNFPLALPAQEWKPGTRCVCSGCHRRYPVANYWTIPLDAFATRLCDDFRCRFCSGLREDGLVYMLSKNIFPTPTAFKEASRDGLELPVRAWPKGLGSHATILLAHHEVPNVGTAPSIGPGVFAYVVAEGSQPIEKEDTPLVPEDTEDEEQLDLF